MKLATSCNLDTTINLWPGSWTWDIGAGDRQGIQTDSSGSSKKFTCFLGVLLNLPSKDGGGRDSESSQWPLPPDINQMMMSERDKRWFSSPFPPPLTAATHQLHPIEWPMWQLTSTHECRKAGGQEGPTAGVSVSQQIME